VLVPNLKGAERAIADGRRPDGDPAVGQPRHSLANLRKTPDDVIAEVAKIVAARDAAGSKTLVEGGCRHRPSAARSRAK
jgi:hydroxymethylglutaryl-CoA lyase